MALPSGYTRLDYIESSGTQYIDTGFKPNGNTQVDIKFKMVNQGTAQQSIFGARPGSSGRFTVFTGTNSAALQVDYGTESSLSSPDTAISGLSLNTMTELSMSNALVVNGTTVKTVSAVTFTSTYNLYLFANNNAGVVQLPSAMLLYFCKIYDNGTLVRDFIPCKNASGAIGLWDNVNSVFYANAGTGTFSTGKKHKVLINDTGYEIKSGRVLIVGTGYDIKKGRTLIGGTGYDIKFGTPVGELPAGTIVYMNVDGVRTPYIVVHQGNPDTSAYGASCNGTWVLMKDIYTLTRWQNRQNTRYDEEYSCLVRQLAQTFPSKLETVIQNNLIPLKLLNVYSFQDISGDKVFPLTSDDLSKMDYFRDGIASKRIANYNGVANGYWLRDPSSDGSSIKYVTATGVITTRDDNSYFSSYQGQGFRPLYILNTASLMADSDFNIIEP